MLRVLEVVGMLAPLIGGVLLVVHRRRIGSALPWGIVGCLCALAGSAVGLIGPRAAFLEAVMGDGGLAGILDGLATWVVVRLGLLLVSVVLLLVAAVSGPRDRGTPLVWVLPGLALVALGAALHFVHPELGGDHERLNWIADLLVETVQFGLLGLGVLGLCGAVVARRDGDDELREPGELLRVGASAAMRLYARSRGGGERW